MEFVIPAQSLKQTWDLNPGAPAESGLPAEVYLLLSPRTFNPVQHGVMSVGQALELGSWRKLKDEWLVEAEVLRC